MKKTIAFNLFCLTMLCMLSGCDTEIFDPTLSLSQNKVEFDAEGGIVYIGLNTNQKTLSFKYSDADWLSVVRQGDSLVVAAPANPDAYERSTTVTVFAGALQTTFDVTQATGSKYPGFVQLTDYEAWYLGYYLSYHYDMECEDSGFFEFEFTSKDKKLSFILDLYAEPYATPEEVCIRPGVYKPGRDDYSNYVYVGEPYTFLPGGTHFYDQDGDREDEEYFGGTTVTVFSDDKAVDAALTSGTVTVTTAADGIVTIMVDLVDTSGKPWKCYYEGEIVFDCSDARWTPKPERGDPTAVTEVTVIYEGDKQDVGATACKIVFYTEDIMPTTFIEFNCEAMSFDELCANFGGEWGNSISLPDGNTYAPGTTNLGTVVEIMGSVFPTGGSYTMFSMQDFIIADLMAAFTVEPGTVEGTYNIAAMIANQSYETVMIDLTDMPITFIDATQEDSGDE